MELQENNFPVYFPFRRNMGVALLLLQIHNPGIAEDRDINDPNFFQVLSRPKEEVEQACTTLIDLLFDLGQGAHYNSPVPSRNPVNQRYSVLLDRNILHNLAGVDPAHAVNRLVIRANRVGVIVGMAATIFGICQANTKLTTQGLYYSVRCLYRNQPNDCKRATADLCCLFECTRRSFQLVPSDAGRVVGPLLFDYNGDVINCMFHGGVGVPRKLELVGQMVTSARFVLVVGKDSIFFRLAKHGFHLRYPCIMITGRGQLGNNTKEFLRLIWLRLGRLPVLMLCDGDIGGFVIISTIALGSQAMSYDNRNLVTPNIMWLGILQADIDHYGIPGIPDDALAPLTPRDRNMALNWANKPAFGPDTRRFEWGSNFGA